MNTALHIAVTKGNMAIVKMLVEADPDDKHIRNCDDETPMYIAAKLGHNDILMMIGRGCTDPGLDGPEGTTALHAAITMLPQATTEYSDVVEVIIDVAGRQFSGIPLYDDRYNNNFIRQADNKCKNTALHLAVQGKHLGVVEQILKAYPSHSPDDKNSDLKTPNFIAAEQGYKDILEVLGKNYVLVERASGPRNQTALHAAITGRDTDCVRIKLEYARELVNSCDDVGWTPLHYAAYYKFDSVLDMIIKAHARSRLPCDYGGIVPTPLWLATKEGHTSTVLQLMKLLPALCVEINHDEGRNILHLAAFQSDKEMILSILKYCPAKYIDRILNGKDVNRDTPLHLLMSKGCFVAELINHKGIDKMARNNQNWTPFEMIYFQDDIVADQLQIKKALDDIQANHHSNFWRRSNKLESNTQESLVPPRKKSRKDAAFKMAKRKMVKEEVERYRQRTNTQIIVTALITTVTFTVGFTMPGG